MRASQWPSASATALAECPAISTCTTSPGLDHPQIVFSFPRCSTMLSPNIGLMNGKETSSAAIADAYDKKIKVQTERNL